MRPSSFDLTQQTLYQLMKWAERTLHPGLYPKMLHQIGVQIGQSANQYYLATNKPHTPFSQQDYILCVQALLKRVGLQYSIPEVTKDSITFQIPTCAFGNCAVETTDVCLVESGILGGIAAEHFGTSKVSIHRGKGTPPRNCHAVVYLGQSTQSAAAEGTVYPVRFDSSNNRVPGDNLHHPLARLSLRERQILRLVGEGLPNKTIATVLHRSVRTIEGHLGRMQAKLEIKGRAELIRLALRSNLARL